MDYRMLYEKLVAEAEENGLGGEFVDWGDLHQQVARRPGGARLYGWLLENEPEGDGREVGKANRLGDGNRRNGIEQAA